MRSMDATPPMGRSVMSGVRMPKRRAMTMWPNSCSTTHTNRIATKNPAHGGLCAAIAPRHHRHPGEQQEKRRVKADGRAAGLEKSDRPAGQHSVLSIRRDGKNAVSAISHA